MTPSSIVLLPGLDGTGDLFARFIAAAPPQFALTSVSLPLAALSYGELADHVARNLPAEEPFVVIAEAFRPARVGARGTAASRCAGAVQQLRRRTAIARTAVVYLAGDARTPIAALRVAPVHARRNGGRHTD